MFDQRETGGIFDLTFASRVVLGQNGGTVDVELGIVPKYYGIPITLTAPAFVTH